jgi:hypothetical protein
MDTGWTVGGKVGYDFVGPRVELEGMYHYNTGSAVDLPDRLRQCERQERAGLGDGQRAL